MSLRPRATGGLYNRSRFVEMFLDMLTAERGVAQNTVESYGRDLAHFEKFLGRRRRTLESAEAAHIRRYLKELSEAGMAASTSARRLSTFRQFYHFLNAEHVRDDDPSTGLLSLIHI